MSSKTKTTATKEEATSALVPKLRFPEFRKKDGWEQKTGNRLFDQINDRRPEPGLPVLAITQEHGAIPRHMIDYHVSVTEKSIESYKVVQVGDFIISLRSFQGGIEYSQYHGICSPAYVILRKRGEGSDAYFRHYLKTDRFIQILTKNLEGLRDGKMVSYAQFSELLIPVPSPPEQQRIAECLSSVDELIAAQARKLDGLKTHKKGLMEQLFPREGETQPRLRFPEFENGGEWAEKALGAMSKTTIGEFVIKTKQRPDAPYPVFNGGRSHTGFYDQFNNEGNKIVISARGANAGYVNIVKQRYWAGNSCYSVSLKDSNDCLEFVYWFMKQNEKTFTENQHAANIPAVSKGHVECFKIMLPSPKEQQRIASCLSSLDALITAETQKHEAFKTHKKGLMQQLFPSPEE